MQTPTVNIGDRQSGRISADSVINCGTSEEEIVEALEMVFSKVVQEKAICTVNPYEGVGAAKNIAEVLVSAKLSNVLKKPFYDVQVNGVI